MPHEITDVGQLPDVLESIDWDAPESGQFLPRVFPGTYDFIFQLPEAQEEQFMVVMVGDAPHLQVNWTAMIPEYAAQGRYVSEGDSGPVPVNFQRHSTYRSPRMQISMLGDLLRCLSLRLDNPPTRQAIINAFRGASEKAVGRAEFGWRAYCKSCEQEISTHPRKRKKGARKDDLPWPRDDRGRHQLAAHCSCGTTMYGRENVINFRLPERVGLAEEAVPF